MTPDQPPRQGSGPRFTSAGEDRTPAAAAGPGHAGTRADIQRGGQAKTALKEKLFLATRKGQGHI